MSKKPRIQNEEFVRRWLEAESAGALARELGVARQAVYIRAAKLRKLGVKLPFARDRRVNVDRLNKIIEDHLGKKDGD